MLDKEVIVIGAGLAGLSAALTLQSSGCRVHVIEASDRAGGRMASDQIDGFILDRGFQLINARYPELQRLGVIQALDFQFAERAVDVSLHEKVAVIGDPRSHLFAGISHKTGSLGSKIRFLNYLVSSASKNANVADDLSSLGPLYEKVLRPFLSGVFLTDPSNVGAVPGKEIIRSFIKGRPGVPARGVGQLPSQLAARISQITFNRNVDSLAEFTNTPVIVATDVTTAAQLLDMPRVPRLAASTTWYHEVPSSVTASARLRIDGLHRGPVVNSIAISHLASGYAPQGKTLLSSTSIEFASESEIRRHLSMMWSCSSSDWSLIAKYEIPKSLPIFGVESHQVTSAKVRDGVYVAGDYRSAPSQNGALLAGRLAAEELLLNQGI